MSETRDPGGEMAAVPAPLDAPAGNPFTVPGRRVLVLGLGTSGLAAARHAVRAGAQVRVVDTRVEPPQLASLREQLPEVGFEALALDDIALDDTDLVIWSPGISIEIGDGARFSDRLASAGISRIGELDLFLQALHAVSPRARVAGITGTNGKTTVCSLAAQMAQATGAHAIAAGNIGPSMLDAVGRAFDEGRVPDIWFLELSSFQLALSEGFDPDVATVLNVTPDHADWHASFESYAAAKERVFGAGTTRILPIGAAVPSATTVVHRFGSAEPVAIGDTGLVHNGGIVWLAQAQPGELEVSRKRGAPVVAPIVRRLMPADVLQIRGTHNHLNALAALALCSALELPMAAMLHALRDYRGQAHRCELLACINDVEYYDDSKGTNVGSTCAALAGLGRRAWLIAGGVGKDQDFSPLLAPVADHAAGVILFGQDAARIAAAIETSGVRCERVDDLPAAVASAARQAQAGEAVLLSPACASFDMFRDYRHRGEVFADLVRTLGEARSQLMELPC